MQAVRRIIRMVALTGASMLIALGCPIIVLADDATTPPAASTPAPASSTTPASTATPTPTTTTPVATAPPLLVTTSSPVAAAPTTTTPSVAPQTSPTNSSPSTAPAPAPPKTTYTYDSVTGHWNSNSWVYDPISGTYKPVVTPIPTPPASTSLVANPSSTGGVTGQAAVSDATTAAIANALNSTSGSGNASVLKNTTGGNATTGNANAVATIVNNVNSSMTSASNKQAASFVSNVMGDVNGDIMLQPMLLKAMLEAGAQSPTTTNNINSVTSNAAANNVTLASKSGNATVASNTAAGNATSGSANTVADVVNIVNSMVAANQSFIGTINIYGNLNGDILIAPDFIPKLLASNAAPSSASTGATTVNSRDTQSIVNNISLAAKSGQALVTGNTSAGNATTGNAATNTVIFNLTGHQIVASNSLLVFVNVLGHWVGVIVDAPSGATAAALGSGVTTDSVTPNLVINSANTTQLTNNINLASQSGDATVTHNTSAGNAQSGSATASANVANISNSQLGLSGWFGVLFINVFGNWIGSFGVNTAAGDPPIAPQLAGQAVASANGSRVLPVMAFLPHTLHHTTRATIVQGGVVTPPSTPATTTTDQPSSNSSVPADTTTAPQATIRTPLISIPAFNLPLLIGSTLLTGVSLFGIRKLS